MKQSYVCYVYFISNIGAQKYYQNITIYSSTHDSPLRDFKLAVVLQVALWFIIDAAKSIWINIKWLL